MRDDHSTGFLGFWGGYQLGVQGCESGGREGEGARNLFFKNLLTGVGKTGVAALLRRACGGRLDGEDGDLRKETENQGEQGSQKDAGSKRWGVVYVKKLLTASVFRGRISALSLDRPRVSYLLYRWAKQQEL
jgi:hypothetical protein